MPGRSGRNLNIDIIRIIATLMIFTAHITALIYERPDFFGKPFWWINHIVLSICRIGTPLFFMMSGYLLANKKRTTKDNVRHTFLRLGIPFISFYIFSIICVSWIHNTPVFSNILIKLFVGGGNYLYFLIGLIVLYLILPILQRLFDSFSQTEVRSVILVLLINTSLYTLGAFLLSSDAHVPNPTFLYWFLTMGYFLYGIYLNRYPDKRINTPMKTFLLSFMPILFNILISYLTQNLFVRLHKPVYLQLSYYLQSYLGITIILSSTLFFKGLLQLKMPSIFNKTQTMWESISKHSFGIYLVHMIILEYLIFRTPLTIDNGPFNPAIMLVLIWSVLFVASFSFSFIVRNIPYVKAIVGERSNT